MAKKPNLEPKLEAIFAALEDSRYEWRTVSGVASDTQLSREDVLEGLIELIDSNVVIRSEVPSEKGDELFTTRDHYRKFSSITNRISASLRNRAS